MNKKHLQSSIPLRVREACAVGLEKAVPAMVRLVMNEDAPAGARVSGFDKLGKYGLGGSGAVLVENAAVAKLAVDLVREMFGPSEAKVAEFSERLADEIEALGGGEIEHSPDEESDD